MVVRSRARVKPLFVSPGPRCDLDGAVALILDASNKYRLPLPSRMAHEFVNAPAVGPGRRPDLSLQ